ncbi:MAG: TonB-dependent receptor [Candidatus Binatia bacterium]|nr:TonB-dependent receptor [Candidatus Binatia bacterium]
MERLPWAAALLLLIPTLVLAQGETVAPSTYVEDSEEPVALGGEEYEADAAGAQAEAVEDTGSATGLSRRSADRVEEIVVSARKRAERLEDTPVSVTALSESTLREAGITRVDQIQELVPNMTFLQSFAGAAGVQIRLRGVGTSAPGPAFDPGVGFYVDGVFLSRAQGALIDVVDVQQIEVLRGPQGTLFGKNTVGGSVNLTTVKPGPDQEGFIMVRPGNLGAIDTRAMVNLPIGSGWLEDRLFTRLAFASAQNRGYNYNAFRDEYVSDRNSLSFLGSLRFLPIDDVTIDVSGTWSKDITQGRGGQCVNITEGGLTALVPGDYPAVCAETRPFESGANLDQLSNISNYGTWGTIRWAAGDLGPIEDIALKSLTSWRQQSIRTRTDLEGSRIAVVDVNQAGGSPTDGTPGSAQQIQQELQLNASTWDGRINLVSGLFTYWEKAEAGNTVFVHVTPTGTPTATNSAISTDNFTWALYGQGTADVTDWLSLTAGIRYTSDRKGVAQFNQDTFDPSLPGSGGSGEKTFQSWTPMGTIALLAPESWIDETPIDHLMTYFRYSRGFKGGGFNAAVQAASTVTPSPYDPETLDNFEVGFKTITFDRRVTMNVALFYGKYEDIQITAQRSLEDEEGNLTVQRLTLNAAKATTQGAEVEIQARPLPGLNLSGTLGYLDATYDNFPGALSDLNGQAIDRGGQGFNNAPSLQTFLSVQYSLPVSAGLDSSPWLEGWITPRLEWAYRDRYHVLGPEVSETVQPGYNLINARLSYDFLDDRAQVALWGKNLIDEGFIDDAFAVGAAFGSALRFYGLPRTYGAELSYRF